jgi:SAM-dependent methyltransferase
MGAFARIDRWLFRHAGYPYLRATRDNRTFERFGYLARNVRDWGRQVSVLDVGCGGGQALFMLARSVPNLVTRYVGLDFQVGRLAGRYNNVAIPHDFFETNLDDEWNHGTFDLVWSSECLEHIVDDRGVFRKMVRSVRPGGRIVVTMPSLASRQACGGELPFLLETSTTQDGGHVRVGYTRESLQALAEGTAAHLARVDAVSRADIGSYRRRYRWPPPIRLASYTVDTLRRAEEDCYTLEATGADLAGYESIAAVYEIR